MRRSLVLALAVLLAVTLIPAGSSAKIEACRGDTLVTCRAEAEVDRDDGTLALDLEVTSPAAGTLPGSGRAQRKALLTGSTRLARAAPLVALRFAMDYDRVAATFEQAVARPIFGGSNGSWAKVEMRIKAEADSCRSSCTTSYERVLANSQCGGDGSLGGPSQVTLYLSNDDGGDVPAGDVRYSISLSGIAAVGSFPFGEPARPDSGSAKASAEMALSRARAAPAERPYEVGVSKDCFFGTSSRQGTMTRTAGKDVVFGRGYLVNDDRSAGSFIVAAHGSGAAAGASGAFAPAWYELLLHDGDTFHIKKGTLERDEYVVADDGDSTSLKVPLGRFGKATMTFQGGGGTSPMVVRELRESAWEIEATLIAAASGWLTGEAGDYEIEPSDPENPDPNVLVYRAAAGSFKTCTRCPSQL